MRRFVIALVLAAWPLLALAGHGDAPVVFSQQLSVPSATVTEAQFLAGTTGVPATVGGELRMPVTPSRIPVVILVHGSAGLSPNVRHWADVLNEMGLGALLLDSFSGRGIADTSTEPARVANAAMLVDAYRALAVLAAHPRVDGRRVAVMGFDTGGWAALYASVRRFQHAHAPKGVAFAAHIALYPPCTLRYLEDDQVSARPIRVFHGTADASMPIDACRRYIAQLRRAGADATLVEVAGARHFFDLPDSPGYDARAYADVHRRVKEALGMALTN